MGRADVFGLGDGLPRLRRGLRVTHLGDERLVLDPASGVVHTVRGAAVRALDAVIAGRTSMDEDLVAVLSGAGIIEGQTVGRRELLALSGTGTLLIASSVLPSAVAAASGPRVQVSTGAGTVSEFSVTSGDGKTYLLYRISHESEAQSSGDITRILSIQADSVVDLLLVGGGGGGGVQLQNASDDASGGGGGGEVHEVRLGTLVSGTQLSVTVGGRASAGNSGNETSVTIDSSVVGEARGGGSGAGQFSGAAAGGAGGGGGSFDTRTSGSSPGATGDKAGYAVSGALSTSGSAGGNGDASGSGGGGGGAGGAGSDGSGEAGGSAGGATDVSSFFGIYSTDSSPNPGEFRYVAAGGGGGGLTSGGSGGAGGDSVVIGGAGSTSVALSANPNGVFATGSGGGGGSADGGAAYVGQGASGVAWVRVQVG